jgi:hypothetical protein
MEQTLYGLIYCISFPNGKKYIGQTTKTVEERINQHISVSRSNGQYLLSKAIKKYGESNFNYEVIDEAYNKYQLDILEISYIIYYNSHYIKGKGYNMTDGGEGVCGYIHTEESKNIMSTKSKQYYSNNSIRELKSIEVKKYFENQENRNRLSEQQKIYFIKNPEAKEYFLKKSKEFWSITDNRLIKSIQMKEMHKNNPNIAAEISERMKETHKNNPNIAKENSERMKETHKNNPNIAKEHGRMLKEMHQNNPNIATEISERMKETHKNNPNIAKEHSEFMKKKMNRPGVKEECSKRQKEIMNRPGVKEALSNKIKLFRSTLDGKKMGQPKPFDVFLVNGEYIGTFDYVPFAIDYLNKKNIKIDGHYIRNVLKGRRKTTCGLTFKYKIIDE